MTVYLVAQLKFTNVEAYRRYQTNFPAVFRKFDAKAIVADEEVKVLEGDWPRDKLVILSFPDEAEAQRFWTSPEYLGIVQDRFDGAETTVVLAKGFVPKT